MTLDGVVVVSHDNNLLRVTGKDVNITDCTLNELPNLQSTIYTHFSTTPMESFDKAYKIATLEEVFERFDEQYVSIDIKRASPETV